MLINIESVCKKDLCFNGAGTMKNILFDFDGTLINTWPGIEATLRASLESLKLPIRESTINRSLVGMPLLKVFEELLEGDLKYAERALHRYREIFPAVGMPGAVPFEGVIRMLEELKKDDRDLFLVTARNETITKQMMAVHNLTEFFTWVRGEQEGEVPDNKVHMVAEVLQKFDLYPGSCAMVGDRKYDIEAAYANSLNTVGVTYGYGTREELAEAGAGQLVGSVGELEKALLGKGTGT